MIAGAALVSQAASGAIEAQRALIGKLTTQALSLAAPGVRQLWLVEMWARIAVAHPQCDLTDLGRLGIALSLAEKAAKAAGEHAQAQLYRAEIISITSQIADGGLAGADEAALHLDEMVAQSPAVAVALAQSMQRSGEGRAVEFSSTLTAERRKMLSPAVERSG